MHTFIRKLPCISLLDRIRNIWIKHIRHDCGKASPRIFLYLFIYIIVVFAFKWHNYIYNSWQGPFPMNLDQFRKYLQIKFNIVDRPWTSKFEFVNFEPDYLQVELGKNVIHAKSNFRIYYGHHSYNKILYTFHRVLEPAVNSTDYPLFIKFSSIDSSYFEKRLPYRFEAFSAKTLRCITKSLQIPEHVYMSWVEKALYVENIQKLYNEKPSKFNRKVIIECGIILGYLYRPTSEFIYPTNSYKYHRFEADTQAFDASSPYTSYFSYFALIIISFMIASSIIRLIKVLICFINTYSMNLPQSIIIPMKMLNTNSIEDLDELLSSVHEENKHYDHLFIIENKYLVLFTISSFERDEKILKRFYMNSPFHVILLTDIDKVLTTHIVLSNHQSNRYIHFPIIQHNIHFNPESWLHNRLLSISDRYRRIQAIEELSRQESERQRVFDQLVEEESRYQELNNNNDFRQLWNPSQVASARFIAEFRLSTKKIVNSDLCNDCCTICLENFELGQSYSTWPCTAAHPFHFLCMLNVLRTGNTCPLCRHPVEAAPALDIRVIFQRILQNAL